MPLFRSLLPILLLASIALSAPVTDVVLEARKAETDVCGVVFRLDSRTTRSRCSDKAVYELNKTKDGVVKVDMSGKTVPGSYNCDHVLELQVLKVVADKSGLCDVIKAVEKVDKTKTPTSLLQAAKDNVNKANNLFFLDQPVNSRKLSIVGNVINNKNGGNAPSKNPNLNKAVKSYNDQVRTHGTDAATAATKDFKAITDTAQKVLDDAKAKRDKAKEPLSNDEKALEAALEKYKKDNFDTVTEQWEKVVKVIDKA